MSKSIKISNRAIDELMQNNENTFHLYCLLRYLEKNESVGVDKEITKYKLSKKLNLCKNTIKRSIDNLAKLGFIRVYQQSPLIIQFIDIYPNIEPLQGNFNNNK